MSFKSKEQLIDFVNQQGQKRKRELISIRQSLKTGREHEQKLLCRGAILLSYAHWEGFVKDIAFAYVAYVAFKAPAFEILTQNFQALAFRTKITVCGKATKRIQRNSSITAGRRQACFSLQQNKPTQQAGPEPLPEPLFV